MNEDLTLMQDLLERAATYYRHADYGEAASCWNQILDIDLSHTDAMHNLACCYADGKCVPQDFQRAEQLGMEPIVLCEYLVFCEEVCNEGFVFCFFLCRSLQIFAMKFLVCV